MIGAPKTRPNCYFELNISQCQKGLCTEHEKYIYPLHCGCYFLQRDTRRQFESRDRRWPLYEDEGITNMLIIQLKPSVATVKSVTCRARSKSSPRGRIRHERTNDDILINFRILVPRNVPPHEDTNCKPRVCLKYTLMQDGLLRSKVTGSKHTCKINTFLV